MASAMAMPLLKVCVTLTRFCGISVVFVALLVSPAVVFMVSSMSSAIVLVLTTLRESRGECKKKRRRRGRSHLAVSAWNSP